MGILRIKDPRYANSLKAKNIKLIKELLLHSKLDNLENYEVIHIMKDR